jgi:hypothetical protein
VLKAHCPAQQRGLLLETHIGSTAWPVTSHRALLATHLGCFFLRNLQVQLGLLHGGHTEATVPRHSRAMSPPQVSATTAKSECLVPPIMDLSQPQTWVSGWPARPDGMLSHAGQPQWKT